MLPVSHPCTTTVGLSQTRGPNMGSSGEDEELEEKEWKEEVTACLSKLFCFHSISLTNTKVFVKNETRNLTKFWFKQFCFSKTFILF